MKLYIQILVIKNISVSNSGYSFPPKDTLITSASGGFLYFDKIMYSNLGHKEYFSQ